MNEIKINTTRLGTDAAQVLSLINNMDKQLKDMKSSLNQLNKMWDGPARKVFSLEFVEDIIAAEKVINELKSLHGFETEAKKKYEKCEHKVSALVDAIKI